MIKNLCRPFSSLVLFAAVPCAVFPAPATAQVSDHDLAESKIIVALDHVVFDAYNRCDLKGFGRWFSPSVEFYHDKGGVTYDLASVINNTSRYICGKVRRELIPETLKVYPIKDFGAIEEGEHRFCDIQTGSCEGIAKFLIIWNSTKTGWQITRVMSYGHRTASSTSGDPRSVVQPTPQG